MRRAAASTWIRLVSPNIRFCATAGTDVAVQELLPLPDSTTAHTFRPIMRFTHLISPGEGEITVEYVDDRTQEKETIHLDVNDPTSLVFRGNQVVYFPNLKPPLRKNSHYTITIPQGAVLSSETDTAFEGSTWEFSTIGLSDVEKWMLEATELDDEALAMLQELGQELVEEEEEPWSKLVNHLESNIIVPAEDWLDDDTHTSDEMPIGEKTARQQTRGWAYTRATFPHKISSALNNEDDLAYHLNQFKAICTELASCDRDKPLHPSLSSHNLVITAEEQSNYNRCQLLLHSLMLRASREGDIRIAQLCSEMKLHFLPNYKLEYWDRAAVVAASVFWQRELNCHRKRMMNTPGGAQALQALRFEHDTRDKRRWDDDDDGGYGESAMGVENQLEHQLDILDILKGED
eukprot:TRINITY_DN12218_c0_g1_i1.p1 TRINITY_DN12218_c0_g1~~TRINITY_DN12218_c0_g1_i1.p1  ORF type:complete len:405 (+),score=32.24 TRINITY_DN12218_c0_g1_i1:50-1264(+)